MSIKTIPVLSWNHLTPLQKRGMLTRATLFYFPQRNNLIWSLSSAKSITFNTISKKAKLQSYRAAAREKSFFISLCRDEAVKSSGVMHAQGWAVPHTPCSAPPPTSGHRWQQEAQTVLPSVERCWYTPHLTAPLQEYFWQLMNHFASQGRKAIIKSILLFLLQAPR